MYNSLGVEQRMLAPENLTFRVYRDTKTGVLENKL